MKLKIILQKITHYLLNLILKSYYILKNIPKVFGQTIFYLGINLGSFQKEKIVSNFPIYVLIEPVSTCNIRCTMCFQIDKSFTRKPFMGTMTMDFFKEIIDDCYANGTKAITLASRGEPTLHPKLSEMLDYVSNKFLEVKLNTNATRLNEKLIRKILETNVNELVYSVDESDEKKYEKIRVGGKFKEVVNNIKNFKKIRDSEFPNSKTTTRISGVLVNEDQECKNYYRFLDTIC